MLLVDKFRNYADHTCYIQIGLEVTVPLTLPLLVMKRRCVMHSLEVVTLLHWLTQSSCSITIRDRCIFPKDIFCCIHKLAFAEQGYDGLRPTVGSVQTFLNKISFNKTEVLGASGKLSLSRITFVNK